jgi:hypothetical protein
MFSPTKPSRWSYLLRELWLPLTIGVSVIGLSLAALGHFFDRAFLDPATMAGLAIGIGALALSSVTTTAALGIWRQYQDRTQGGPESQPRMVRPRYTTAADRGEGLFASSDDQQRPDEL